MAPVGMVSIAGWLSSPEVGVISLVAFLVLSITLLALCAVCRRTPTNAYDVSGTTTEGGGANGTKTGGTAEPAYSNWRDHRNMPPSTLDRSHASTK